MPSSIGPFTPIYAGHTNDLHINTASASTQLSSPSGLPTHRITGLRVLSCRLHARLYVAHVETTDLLLSLRLPLPVNPANRINSLARSSKRTL